MLLKVDLLQPSLVEVDLYLLSEAKLGKEPSACHRLVVPQGQAHPWATIPAKQAATAPVQQAQHLDLEEQVWEQESLQGARAPTVANIRKNLGQRMPQQSGLESLVVRWRWVLLPPVSLVPYNSETKAKDE